jgi:hypothetical protein
VKKIISKIIKLKKKIKEIKQNKKISRLLFLFRIKDVLIEQKINKIKLNGSGN